MGNTASATVPASIENLAPASNEAPGEKPKCKACCACPVTKKIRDECVLLNGEENCGEVIEKHKQCMRDMGFNI